MCGICGFVRFQEPADASVLEKMTFAIRHRGPDDEGYMLLDSSDQLGHFHGTDSIAAVKNETKSIAAGGKTKLGFGFRRLSIVDLSAAGHQPMFSEDGSHVLTFNGEIYNYKELRKELQSAGFHFRTESDSEVILHGYRRWGNSLPKYLNGMFAFAIYDAKQKSVFLVRDRVGIKPFFYHRDEKGLTWSSEIKAILQAPWVKRSINFQGLASNFLYQSSAPPETCFENIHSIPPGCWMRIDMRSGRVEEQCYWQIPVGGERLKISKEDAVAALDARLQKIVQMQMQADVPVTSLMSGGIDSTTLTALCSKQHPDFHSYSLGFDGTGKGMDELPQAIAMAKKLNIVHHVHIIKPEEIIGNLEASLQHYEEPYVSLEPGLAASDYLHKEGYKVVINGLGGDEVFGGYNYYLNYREWERRKKIFPIRKFLPSVGEFLTKAIDYMSTDTVLKYFTHARLGMRYSEIARMLKGKADVAKLLPFDAAVENLSVPEALFYYDLKYYIGAHHVYRDDLTGMAHSLEMRYPLLDHELIEWVAKLPLHIRYNGETNKPLLREVASKYITTENLSMPKKGFELPLQQWLQQNSVIEDFARKKIDQLKQRGILDLSDADKWWARKSESIYFSKIWQLVTTEVWLEKYL
ncbi:asparagine synthase (glutamine-hydrolyzing) [Taibaiella soli]|uniref:asparagine synthase (glutamine-hydrolyzing) n=1 Tax=Taibaiella soli TaxID=1649169 RepID=A0A2W2B0D3_9BACT|nr:asparagine synthase (glutamine-hydrolyzing) [Taibaiella soli]PZF73724.1 asparagine synthase (glutamine-hydrolyzing) [Taibaiella soli]